MQLFQLDTLDLKMVNFLLGQQRVSTKYPCYLCLWDNRAREKHWNQKEWPIRETLKAGVPNLSTVQLSVEKRSYFLCSISSWAWWNSLSRRWILTVNASKTFSVLPGLPFEKIKAGVFNEPQTDQEFTRKMNDKERTAWFSFVAVMANFFGNKKADNYETLVANMMSAFHNLGCNLSVKLHYL